MKKNFVVIFISRSKSKIESIYRKYKIKNLYGIVGDLIDNTAIPKIIDFLEKNKIILHSLINNARNTDYLKLVNGPMPNRSKWIEEYILDIIVPYELSVTLSYWQYSKSKPIVNISSMYGVVSYNYNL